MNFPTVRTNQPAAHAAEPVHCSQPLTSSSSFDYEYTLTSLVSSVNEEVVIRLKWGQTEYKGRLVSIDSYMNIQLSGAEEWIDQQKTSALGQVLIRYVYMR